ncbi:MAG TPA: hypothetical protein ENJ79_04805 [Gammaproteobacteria bacterium]|nr:hypothetical protein [Gammaproteobacteria bacterium]
MFKKYMLGFAISAAILVSNTSAATISGDSCMHIGGMGMPNFVPQPDGTTTIVAPLTGSVATASGRITAQRETKTGLEMDMEHYFMTKKGGFMHTRDLAVLSRVAGKKGRYMIEITYHIQESSTSGVLKGYKGNFKSYGLVDLENLQGLIRYSGSICK